MGLCLFGFAIGKFFPDMSDGAFPWNFSRLPVEWIMMDSHCISLHMFKVMLFTDYTMVNYHETPPFGKCVFFFRAFNLRKFKSWIIRVLKSFWNWGICWVILVVHVGAITVLSTRTRVSSDL